MTLSCLLIPADDDAPVRTIDVEHTWQAMAKTVGGDYIERVRCALTPHEGVVLVVDEEFLYRDHQTRNRRASLLYGGVIRGDALLVAERLMDGPDPGIDFVTLDQEKADHIMSMLPFS